MMFLTALLLALTPSAQAGGPQGLKFVSLCGSYDQQLKVLTVSGKHRVFLVGDVLPSEKGDYCFRGSQFNYRGMRSGWKLRALGFGQAQAGLKFPVMICAEMEGEEFSTTWNESPLHFKGPYPTEASLYGWCADGVGMPVRQKGGWRFDNSQFRAMPNPNQRSGMSIGNQ